MADPPRRSTVTGHHPFFQPPEIETRRLGRGFRTIPQRVGKREPFRATSVALAIAAICSALNDLASRGLPGRATSSPSPSGMPLVEKTMREAGYLPREEV